MMRANCDMLIISCTRLSPIDGVRSRCHHVTRDGFPGPLRWTSDVSGLYITLSYSILLSTVCTMTIMSITVCTTVMATVCPVVAGTMYAGTILLSFFPQPRTECPQTPLPLSFFYSMYML